ncbi:eukaryotic translation initiation factor 4e class ii [Moniliophthora roreri MCA 2997]|uniref:Eukaryotic translation initiation factor 4e class ii n=2 Tax=Moniliophthora roreri TaxID=221103 RepID=V2Y7L8_MONRO|nr:eukaryotic translation initiation factor 4e class ii [Moniliophthora roreri MCA 2997]KAI3595072.1 eukaryotic translation initiation factor 4e class ii [Moniliophthora roreri]
MTDSKRLPSLDQLAAKLSNANATDGASPAVPRPRLPLTALRTSSSTSLNTTTSSADSMSVNPPATRSTSPSALTVNDDGASTPSTTEGVAPPPGGDSTITADKLEKLQAQQDSATPSPNTQPGKRVKGYKNIPSLDAITARLVRARTFSIDGSPKPPEPELIEDPKTPGLQMKPPEHPLQHSWTIYHDTKAKVPFTPTPQSADGSAATAFAAADQHEYEAGLTVIGTFTTVEQFCRYFNWLKPPSKLERNSNYHLFKAPIKPMWEDPANANGGKWVLTMKNNPNLLDRCWNWVAMALVGEELEEDQDEICGAVVSLRSKVDRIQVWTRSKEDVEKINGIGRKLVKLLDVGEKDNIGLEFQYNTDDRPLPNKFLSIQAMPPTSSFRSSTFGVGSPVTPVGGGGGGGFVPGGGSGGHGHHHTRSVGGANDQQTPAQVNDRGPMSAAPGGGGGGFIVGGGAFGGWRK